MSSIGTRRTAAVVLSLVLAACGSSGPTANRGQPTGRPPGSTATSPPVSVDKKASGRVSANHATKATLERTFARAGIASSQHWAEVVADHRPYPAGDPSFAGLRQTLAQYGPSQDTVDRVVAALELP